MSPDRHTVRTINDFLRGILILLVLGEDNNPLSFKRIDGPHCTWDQDEQSDCCLDVNWLLICFNGERNPSKSLCNLTLQNSSLVLFDSVIRSTEEAVWLRSSTATSVALVAVFKILFRLSEELTVHTAHEIMMIDVTAAWMSIDYLFVSTVSEILQSHCVI